MSAAININAPEEAKRAYAIIRGSQRPEERATWPMSHWDDLEPALRNLLVMMWTCGCDRGGRLMGAGPSTAVEE